MQSKDQFLVLNIFCCETLNFSSYGISHQFSIWFSLLEKQLLQPNYLV